MRITSGVLAAGLAAGMPSACSLDVTGSLAGSQGEAGTTASSGGTGSSTSTTATGTAAGSTTGGADGTGGAGGAGGGSACGNGALEPGEECDDGGTIAADGCSPACATETLDTCPGAAVSLMPSMPSMLTIPGDLTGKGNDTRGTCGGSNSPELVYAVTPSVTGTLNVMLDGSFNKTLYVRTECASGAAPGQLACVNGMGAQALSLWVEVGKTYYVFVDGKASDKGIFTLTLALLPCGNGKVEGLEQCDDGNANDGDGCSGCLTCSKPDEFPHPSTHHCYRLTNDMMSWFDARSSCAVWGGDLVAFDGAEELEFIGGAVSTTVLWTGGNDIESEGAFEWSNGEAWYAAWTNGEPNNVGLGENCVELVDKGNTYSDRACGDKHPFLCERAPAPK